MAKEKDWSVIAKNFDEKQDYIVGESTNRIIKEELGKLKDLGEVIEFGCGNGKFTKLLVDASKNITATDMAEEMVEITKRNLQNHKNVITAKADCYKTAYADNCFDTVFMANLIHVVLEPEKALKEATRVLKNNGNLILLSFTIDGMEPDDIETMKQRYLEVFGAFPEKDAPLLLRDLKKLVKAKNFSIEKAVLIGDKTKAMFVSAKKLAI